MIRQELPLRQGYGITCTRFTLTFSDLAALATGVGPFTLPLTDANGNAFQVAQGGIVTPGIRMKSDTAFSGGSNTSLGVTVGKTGGSATFFVSASYDLFAAVSDTNVSETSLFKAGQDAAFGIGVTVTGDGTHNINAFTAGQFHVDIFVAQFGPINTQANVPSVTP